MLDTYINKINTKKKTRGHLTHLMHLTHERERESVESLKICIQMLL